METWPLLGTLTPPTATTQTRLPTLGGSARGITHRSRCERHTQNAHAPNPCMFFFQAPCLIPLNQAELLLSRKEKGGAGCDVGPTIAFAEQAVWHSADGRAKWRAASSKHLEKQAGQFTELGTAGRCCC
ncbi:hypothetical protein MRX96_008290 [Rhipicephalus microplus]